MYELYYNETESRVVWFDYSNIYLSIKVFYLSITNRIGIEYKNLRSFVENKAWVLELRGVNGPGEPHAGGGHL